MDTGLQDIESTIMATLIDDGLLESVDDPISLMEFGQPTIIDVDDINATIEDPGYILEDNLESYNLIEEEEEYMSSYKKQSFTIPVTFFDITRNITLLKKCRPISIKIVDCKVYPWYYKKIKQVCKGDEVISIDNDNSPQQTHGNERIDLQGLTNSLIKKSLSSPVRSRSPKINLSSEQLSVILNLNEEIKVQVEEIHQNEIDVIEKEINVLRTDENAIKMKGVKFPELKERTSDYSSNKSIESNDLLTYETIAQTIVRNIKKGEVRNSGIAQVGGIRNDSSKKCGTLINYSNSENEKNVKGRKKKKETQSEHILTSPILPCTTRPKKTTTKTKPRQNTKLNNVTEKSHKVNKHCDKVMSSNNKVIPHYHCSQHTPVNSSNNNINIPCLSANPIYSQELTSKNSAWLWHKYNNSYSNSRGKSDSIVAYDAQGRKKSSLNTLGEISNLDSNKTSYNSSHLTNSQVVPDQMIKYIDPIIYASLSDYQYNYPKSYSRSVLSRSQITQDQMIKQIDPNIEASISDYQYNYPRSCNNSVLSSSTVTQNHMTYTDSNIPASISDYQYNFPRSLYYPNDTPYSSDFTNSSQEKNKNSLRPIRRPSVIEAAKEQCHIYSQSSNSGKNAYDYYIPSSVSTLNKYFDYGLQIPVTGAISNLTNVATRNSNPLLTHLLNCNNLREYYDSTLGQEGGITGPFISIDTLPAQSYELPLAPATDDHNYYLATTPFTQNRYVQYPDIEMDYNPILYCQGNCVGNHTSDSQFRHSSVNPTDQSQIKEYNNLRDRPNDMPKISNIMSCRTDFIDGNVFSYPDMFNINQVSSASRGTTGQKENGLPNEPSEIQNKRDYKNMIDSMIKVISTKKSTSLNPNVSKSNSRTEENFQERKKNNALEKQHAASVYNLSLLANTATSERLDSKINVYSPPILPIPSFKKSFAMMSDTRNQVFVGTTENNKLEKETFKNTYNESYEYIAVPRKRKLNDDEKIYIDSKKISLQEYQRSRLDNRTLTYVDIDNRVDNGARN